MPTTTKIKAGIEPSRTRLGDRSQSTSTGLPIIAATKNPAITNNTTALTAKNTRSSVVMLLHLVDRLFYTFLWRKVNRMDINVYFHYIQTGHHFNRPLDVFLNLPSYLGDAFAILNDDRKVHNTLVFAEINLYALGQIPMAQHLCNTAGDAAAHSGYTRDLGGRQAGNNPYNFRVYLHFAQTVTF